METLTWQELVGAIAVIFILAEAFNLAVKTIETAKGLKKPRQQKDQTTDAALADIKTMLGTDKTRLDSHDRDLADLRESDRVLMRGVRALLEHAIHDGNADEMIEAKKDIDVYLERR